MKKSKKAQVTVFIAIGIVILFIIGLVFYLKGEAIKSVAKKIITREAVVPKEFEPAQQFVKDCMSDVTLDSLFVLGLQGGYIGLDGKPFVNYMGTGIAYLNYEENNLVPSLEQMQQHLESYIEDDAKRCADELAYIVSEDIQIVRIPKAKAEVTIFNQRMVAKIKWPIELKKAEIATDLPDFKVELPVRLGELHSITNELVDEQVANGNKICLTCLVDNAIENGIFIQIMNYDNDLVLILNDLKYNVDARTYKFRFANKFV